MTLLGEAGITRLAALNHEAACDLADRLEGIDGVELVNDTFFNEFTLRLPKPAADVVDQLAAKGILGGVPLTRIQPDGDESLLLVAATETNEDDDFAAFEAALTEVLS